ncbi:MAG TPA: PBP1A family penicillin-binding protein [Synergistales bacterium]|nr:PBP1A family penicillin-binding protein [Synergistales bacterium]HRV70692.1 PBP1A family penicillin-binding protein [Thermovirgaceae bacterium]
MKTGFSKFFGKNNRNKTDHPETVETGGKKPKGNNVRGALLAVLVVFMAAIALASVVGAIVIRNAASSLPSLEEMSNYEPDLSTIVYDRNQKVITRLFLENRTWVPLSQISRNMQRSAVAAEDSSFYSHGGLDFSGILRAFWVNVTNLRTKQGASTITQQLARNLFLSREQTLTRKIKEAIISLRLERIYSKDQILEMYLNMIYFGHGAWGIHSASQLYFNKEPSELTLSETSLLAGLVKAPEYYTPIRHPDRAASRQTYVLSRMVQLGMITPEEAQDAQKIELDFHSLKKPALMFDEAPYFISHILFEHLLPTYGSDVVYRGGLRVHTTIDLDVQHAAEKAIQGLKSEGAIVALDPESGEILAMVGGKDFEVSKFNRATQAFRQPGSSFKPFVYTAALMRGLRPVDHALDAPVSYDNGIDDQGKRNIWEPGNYTREFRGEVTLLTALVHSINTVAVRVAHITGVENILDVSRKAGFTSPHLPADLSLALGSASVTPLEMAAAYSIFANDGSKVTPFAIRRVVTGAGEILEEYGPQLTKTIPEEIAVSVRSVLMEVVRSGTGTRARIPGYEVFGKTGTTNEYSDAWFAGGIPGLVTVVYAGNDDHKSLDRPGTGGVIAAPVWQAFMSEAVKYLPVRESFTLPESANVQIVTVCKDTGFLVSGGCTASVIILPDGMAPSSICPLHGGSWAMAASDPNVPRMLLSPRDEEVTGITASMARLYGVSISDTAYYGPMDEISSQQPATTYAPPVSKPGQADTQPEPYVKKERTPEEIEERYQDLLKQYGIEED